MQITEDETEAIFKLECRSRELFRGPFNAIAGQKREQNVIIQEQQSRKKALYLQRDNEIELLEQRKRGLLAKCRQAEERFQEWLNDVTIRWDEQKAHNQREQAGVREQLRMKTEKLGKEESALACVNQEINRRWFFNLFWGTDSDAEQRKRNIEERVRAANSECASIQYTANQLVEGLHHIVMVASRTEDCERKKLKEELGKLDNERSSIESEIATERKKVDDVISGCKRHQLKEDEARIESELAGLRRELKDALRKADGSAEPDLSQLRKQLEASTKTLAGTRESIDAIFCQDTLEEAGVRADELIEKAASVRLGLGHILYKASQAKRQWQIRVESEATTVMQRKKEWKSLMKGLERVFALEENRVFGFPRGGKRDGPMPVYSKRSLLRQLLSGSQALIITAGTGCGKSTNLPQYIADDFHLYRQSEDCSITEAGITADDKPVRICCTQPRRVAAQKLAGRVAQEYITELGDLVGFKVGSRGRAREECVKVSENTVIEFVTEGLLLHNMAKSRAFIERYDCIIIDEMHERNAEQDLCLSLLREHLRESKESRPFFKVVVMSASIDAVRFSEYFDNCPTLDCPGRNFQVAEIYSPPGISVDEPMGAVPHAVDVLFENIVDGAKDATGDVLIFLSGASDIDECVRGIQERASKKGDLVVAYPLYSRLDQGSISKATNPQHRKGLNDEMAACLKRNNENDSMIRKVICTTNIAETSLTIDGVRFVIDSGLAKKAKYDHTLRCPVLCEDSVSRASTIQRKGRAGRTGSGWCYYLFSEAFHKAMKDYDTPKILEGSVDELILFSLSVCGKSIIEMGLLDSPKLEDIQRAEDRLLDLDFVAKTEGRLLLTESGKVACNLSSVRPESVRMMLNACCKFSHITSQAINLAVLMSQSETIFSKYTSAREVGGSNHVYGDHLLQLQHLEWFEKAYKKTKKKNMAALKKRCTERGLDYRILSEIQDDVDRCHRELKKQKKLGVVKASGTSDNDNESLLRVFISGWFHHVVECFDIEFIDRVRCSLLTSPGQELFLDRGSCLRGSLGKLDDQNGLDNAVTDKGVHCPAYGDRGKVDLNILKEEVVPAFLLHGRLFCSLSKKIFMLDASVIEGRWIIDEAPGRWKQRVSFDVNRKTICRVTIKDIGPSIIRECEKCINEDGQNFAESIANSSEVKALVLSLQRGVVRISGTQSAVEGAKTAFAEQLRTIMESRRRSDYAHNGAVGLRFSSGLSVVGRIQQDAPLHQLFLSFGTDEGVHHQSSNVVSILLNRKTETISVYPVRNCSMDAVSKCFKSIAGCSLKRQKHKFLLKLKSDNQGRRGKRWAETAKIVVE